MPSRIKTAITSDALTALMNPPGSNAATRSAPGSPFAHANTAELSNRFANPALRFLLFQLGFSAALRKENINQGARSFTVFGHNRLCFPKALSERLNGEPELTWPNTQLGAGLDVVFLSPFGRKRDSSLTIHFTGKPRIHPL
jgi:hypothetical protein